MIKETEISIPPKYFEDENFRNNLISKKLKISNEEITAVKISRYSIDSRRSPVYRVKYLVFINETPVDFSQRIVYPHVSSNKKVIIVGSGPAGLFAALRLIELGVKPVILERGKDVRSRRRDLKNIQSLGEVNTESNYCFGEGGAGTYSDGKLYTRSTKRGDSKKILNVLVQHGASQDILINSRPHIGSNKLPNVIVEIRKTIINSGGEVHFNSKVTDLIIEKEKLKGVIVNNNKTVLGDAVILATGHSARDIYYMMKKYNLSMEAKEFALGVRVEHPQTLIDQIQYHSKIRHKNLPAAYYSLACQVDGKGIYSFCMCPGGIIIPSSTNNDEVVLNGMSVSRRNSKFANSGLVVTINSEDWNSFKLHNELAGLEFQKQMEYAAFKAGGGKQVAPAQRITDFVTGKYSNSLPYTSYKPGVKSVVLKELFPKNIYRRLKKSLKIFDKKMHGFFTETGQVLGVESRTSSPVRILRDGYTFMHVDVEGLFPAGEGAGYAGGIISAAIDGEKCAEKATRFIINALL